jgi:hypothetical protein
MHRIKGLKGHALHTVLRDEKHGQVHGMGLLLVPNEFYGRIPWYLIRRKRIYNF